MFCNTEELCGSFSSGSASVVSGGSTNSAHSSSKSILASASGQSNISPTVLEDMSTPSSTCASFLTRRICKLVGKNLNLTTTEKLGRPQLVLGEFMTWAGFAVNQN